VSELHMHVYHQVAVAKNFVLLFVHITC
jgi:hypothetical protein